MNKLVGRITQIQSSKHLSIVNVEVGEDSLYLLLVEKPTEDIGAEVDLVFKETEVILSQDSIQASANLCAGKIINIEEGEILSHVTLSYQNTTISALVPTVIFLSMQCQLNDILYWIINPSEISLQRDHL